MKTLLFTLEYPPFHGGVANYYGSLAKYWPEELFVLHNNENKLIGKNYCCFKWLPSIFELKKTVKEKRIDHVLIGQILPLGTAACILSFFIKFKYSVILHGMDFTFAVKNPWKKFLAKFILKKADKIICSNSYVAKLAKNYNKNIYVVNPGVENCELRLPIDELKNKYNLTNKIILLSVGRSVKRKGFDKVIEALPEVLKSVPNLVYVIVGTGEELKNWKLKIGNLGLNNHVLLIEKADDEERNSWYRACDIFIMPSREINGDFEGFGIVYLEANLAGKPVIAGDSGGVRDAVEENVNGLLVNPESVPEIAQVIVKLSSDKELGDRLGEQGRERAINNFHWEAKAKEFYNILNI